MARARDCFDITVSIRSILNYILAGSPCWKPMLRGYCGATGVIDIVVRSVCSRVVGASTVRFAHCELFVNKNESFNSCPDILILWSL